VITTIRIKRPKFYEFFEITPSTTRVCPHEGCDRPAESVQGYYLVGTRRVRQWVCIKHWNRNPQLVLPTPPSILAAEKAEQEYREEMSKKYRTNVDPERGVSVKVLASSGHGLPIPGDRVKAWRWGA